MSTASARIRAIVQPHMSEWWRRAGSWHLALVFICVILDTLIVRILPLNALTATLSVAFQAGVAIGYATLAYRIALQCLQALEAAANLSFATGWVPARAAFIAFQRQTWPTLLVLLSAEILAAFISGTWPLNHIPPRPTAAWLIPAINQTLGMWVPIIWIQAFLAVRPDLAARVRLLIWLDVLVWSAAIWFAAQIWQGAAWTGGEPQSIAAVPPIVCELISLALVTAWLTASNLRVEKLANCLYWVLVGAVGINMLSNFSDLLLFESDSGVWRSAGTVLLAALYSVPFGGDDWAAAISQRFDTRETVLGFLAYAVPHFYRLAWLAAYYLIVWYAALRPRGPQDEALPPDALLAAPNSH